MSTVIEYLQMAFQMSDTLGIFGWVVGIYLVARSASKKASPRQNTPAATRNPIIHARLASSLKPST
jgi:hypothetical protein